MGIKCGINCVSTFSSYLESFYLPFYGSMKGDYRGTHSIYRSKHIVVSPSNRVSSALKGQLCLEGTEEEEGGGLRSLRDFLSVRSRYRATLNSDFLLCSSCLHFTPSVCSERRKILHRNSKQTCHRFFHIILYLLFIIIFLYIKYFPSALLAKISH